jgi:hypothetical protein
MVENGKFDGVSNCVETCLKWYRTENWIGYVCEEIIFSGVEWKTEYGEQVQAEVIIWNGIGWKTEQGVQVCEEDITQGGRNWTTT